MNIILSGTNKVQSDLLPFPVPGEVQRTRLAVESFSSLLDKASNGTRDRALRQLRSRGARQAWGLASAGGGRSPSAGAPHAACPAPPARRLPDQPRVPLQTTS